MRVSWKISGVGRVGSKAAVGGYLLALAIVCAAPAGAEEAGQGRTWHLLQKTGSGRISGILQGLTRKECEFALARIEGRPATQAEIDRQDAWRKRDAEAFKAWRDAHPECKTIASSSPGVPGTGVVLKDGWCAWPSDAGPFGGWRSHGPNDTVSGECFE